MNEIERIKLIMQEEKLNAKEFADEVSISAATVSNILSERNKPSLEVMVKIGNRFRMINSDWLFYGIGSMYRQKVDAQEQLLLDVRPNPSPIDATAIPEIQQVTSATQKKNVQAAKQFSATAQAIAAQSKNAISSQINEKVIDKIISKVIVFFEDGTFQELQ